LTAGIKSWQAPKLPPISWNTIFSKSSGIQFWSLFSNHYFIKFHYCKFDRTTKTNRPIPNARVAYFDNMAITELLNSHGQTKFKVYLAWIVKKILDKLSGGVLMGFKPRSEPSKAWAGLSGFIHKSQRLISVAGREPEETR
jgi:hypothetical protein